MENNLFSKVKNFFGVSKIEETSTITNEEPIITKSKATTPQQLLESLDYSHSWCTSLCHILEIHETSKKYDGGIGLELGSFKGQATLAMSLAGLRMVSYDIDDTCELERMNLLKGREVDWIKARSDNSLNESRMFDVIFHDADHGDTIIPELIRLFNERLNTNGVLMVHDSHQLTLTKLFSGISEHSYYVTPDEIGRELLTITKL
jgi:predicted O-methyltransferase YrrM